MANLLVLNVVRSRRLFLSGIYEHVQTSTMNGPLSAFLRASEQLQCRTPPGIGRNRYRKPTYPAKKNAASKKKAGCLGHAQTENNTAKIMFLREKVRFLLDEFFCMVRSILTLVLGQLHAYITALVSSFDENSIASIVSSCMCTMATVNLRHGPLQRCRRLRIEPVILSERSSSVRRSAEFTLRRALVLHKRLRHGSALPIF